MNKKTNIFSFFAAQKILISYKLKIRKKIDRRVVAIAQVEMLCFADDYWLKHFKEGVKISCKTHTSQTFTQNSNEIRDELENVLERRETQFLLFE